MQGELHNVGNSLTTEEQERGLIPYSGGPQTDRRADGQTDGLAGRQAGRQTANTSNMAATTGQQDALAGVHKYKLKPPTYNEAYGTFEEWKYKLQAYMGLLSGEPERLVLMRQSERPTTSQPPVRARRLSE